MELLENTAIKKARHHPFTEAEKRKYDAGTTEETIVLDRLWNERPDGFVIKNPTDTKGGELVILEFKLMSCVTDQYVKRAKHVSEAQYAPIKSALRRTLGLQGWTVNQKSFIAGARSLNEGTCTVARQPHLFQGDHDQMDTAPDGPSPPLITSFQAWQPNNIRRQKEKEKKGVD